MNEIVNKRILIVFISLMISAPFMLEPGALLLLALAFYESYGLLANGILAVLTLVAVVAGKAEYKSKESLASALFTGLVTFFVESVILAYILILIFMLNFKGPTI